MVESNGPTYRLHMRRVVKPVFATPIQPLLKASSLRFFVFKLPRYRDSLFACFCKDALFLRYSQRSFQNEKKKNQCLGFLKKMIATGTLHWQKQNFNSDHIKNNNFMFSQRIFRRAISQIFLFIWFSG